MTPVTTTPRPPHRVDGRRRQGTDRSAAPLPTLFDATPPGAPARVDAGQRVAESSSTAGNGETLDRLVVASWERLLSHSAAPCLLCDGTMEPGYGAHAAPIGGRCRDCGTTLV